MKILKFGGSSVATAERIQGVIEILKDYKKREQKFAVVFSALGRMTGVTGTTDLIIQMTELAAQGDESYLELFSQFKKRHKKVIKKLLSNKKRIAQVEGDFKGSFKEMTNLLKGVFLLKDVSKRTMDYLLSFGERNSAYLIAQALSENGIKSDYLDARKVVRTDDNFGAAKVDFQVTVNNIKQHFNKNKNLQVITGFIGSTEDKITTTLGRGGSDYTCAIFAAALNAEEIEIWTDVDGVMTADPRKVRKAFSIEVMTYSEAMEMTHFGAKVIHPPTIQPALHKKIPIRIKNTFNPSFPGTLVSEISSKDDSPIKGVTSVSEIALITLQGSGMVGVKGTAARLFNVLATNDINIIMITQGSSEYSITFAIQPGDARRAQSVIKSEFRYEIKAGLIETPVAEKNLSIIAIIGENMKYQPGISGRVFHALGTNGVNIVAIAQGSSEFNISTVVAKEDETKALNAVHEAFFLSDTKVLHLFIVGVGLIGGTLIEQIKRQAGYLSKNRSLEIRIAGLSNSKKMLFNGNGIELDNWKEDLIENGTRMSISRYIDRMKSMNLRNSIFIDNTANKEIPKNYYEILDESISVITPNKIATSSAYDDYAALKNIAKKRSVRFMYETNVGAGLPVIKTLNDLINSGDRILKIEGVLSGSLSFIFNSFVADMPFSDIVKKAQTLGYTEPDPREDLSGADVRRKILILARETGLKMESEDVLVENILPKACINAKTVPQFFMALEKADPHFNKLLDKAQKEKGVLRFIASLENNKAKVSLQVVDENHPFYSLSGSDNMIVFTTERYKERPLVIRGPGAGAEVTAAGVFAEIISLG